MQHRYSHNIKFIHLAVDFLLLNLSFLASYYFKFQELTSLFFAPYSGLLFFVNIAWFLSILIVKPYNISRSSATISHILGKHFTSIILHALLIATFFMAFRVYYYSREHIFVAYLILFFVVSFWKAAFTYLLRQYRLRGYNNRKVVVAGYGEVAEELKAFFMRHKEHGYNFLGFFEDSNHKNLNGSRRGSIDQIYDFILKNEVDEIFCCVPYLEYPAVKSIIDFSERHGRKAKVVTDFRSFYSKGVTLEKYDNIPVLNISSTPIEDRRAVVVKRTFDIAFSLLVVLVGFPLFLFSALMVMFTSKGPVFYVQERVGKGGTPFKMYKFRSMSTDAEDKGPLLSSKGDPRITPWGKFMRKTRIDELPQFYNVLIGNMSIVGPRPERKFFIDQIVERAPHYKYLQVVKPGITSIGQIKFGYAENIDEMVKRLRYDILYLKHVSLGVDLKIILLTILVVFKAEGK